jgi:dihydropteroate synthase
MPYILFVTGRLAEPALRRQLAELAPRAGFEYTVAVLPITVAALATTAWIARHLSIPEGVERVVLPGLCIGELGEVVARTAASVARGPDDLRDLPGFFGERVGRPADYGAFDIEILAEINHAPRLPLVTILAEARKLKASGADLIDLGCDPGGPWTGVGEVVRALCGEGLRVSIDSFDASEVEAAVAAGAELVLSVNLANAAAAPALFARYGCGFVIIPENPATLDGLDKAVQVLDQASVPFRIDPVLEPIGFGFAASLGRYLEVRRRYPQAEMMMGVGNLTELTDVDSAGVNVTLLGFCQELGIRSVLTTEVINWCRSCVRELDFARRLVHYACTHRVLAKNLEPGEATLNELAASIRDRNFRLFAERGLLHVLNDKMLLQGTDPFELFGQMSQREQIEPEHAFYLGYELAKALTALTLGKNYVQDKALRWGFLSMPDESHRDRLRREEAETQGDPSADDC